MKKSLLLYSLLMACLLALEAPAQTYTINPNALGREIREQIAAESEIKYDSKYKALCSSVEKIGNQGEIGYEPWRPFVNEDIDGTLKTEIDTILISDNSNAVLQYKAYYSSAPERIVTYWIPVQKVGSDWIATDLIGPEGKESQRMTEYLASEGYSMDDSGMNLIYRNNSHSVKPQSSEAITAFADYLDERARAASTSISDAASDLEMMQKVLKRSQEIVEKFRRYASTLTSSQRSQSLTENDRQYIVNRYIQATLDVLNFARRRGHLPEIEYNSIPDAEKKQLTQQIDNEIGLSTAATVGALYDKMLNALAAGGW